jgi:hypothetical protein
MAQTIANTDSTTISGCQTIVNTEQRYITSANTLHQAYRGRNNYMRTTDEHNAAENNLHLLQKLVTRDKSWCPLYDPQSKQKSYMQKYAAQLIVINV